MSMKRSGVMVIQLMLADRVKAREKLEEFSKDYRKASCRCYKNIKVAKLINIQVSIQNLENRNEEC